MKRLRGATWKEVIDTVLAATAADDKPILNEICDQIADYRARRLPYLIGDKEYKPDNTHGFVRWLWTLPDGTSTLPDKLPRAFLLLWRDSYVSKWDYRGHPWCPAPFWRCRECKLVLPCTPGNFYPCPVCGNDETDHADLTVAPGVIRFKPPPARRGAAAE